MKMAVNMCCCTALMMVTVVVLVCGSQQDYIPANYASIQQRCQSHPADVLPHPGLCQLYYNCSNHQGPYSPDFHPLLAECPYPLLFSLSTLRCEPFDQVICGSRKELVDFCDYLSGQCSGPNCRGCSSILPPCRGLPDGGNALPWGKREKTSQFMVCQGGRTIGLAYCADQYTLYNTPTYFHPKKRVCVFEEDLPHH